MREIDIPDRDETIKYLEDLNERLKETPFIALGDNYIEQLKASLNYSPILTVRDLTPLLTPLEVASYILIHWQPIEYPKQYIGTLDLIKRELILDGHYDSYGMPQMSLNNDELHLQGFFTGTLHFSTTDETDLNRTTITKNIDNPENANYSLLLSDLGKHDMLLNYYANTNTLPMEIKPMEIKPNAGTIVISFYWEDTSGEDFLMRATYDIEQYTTTGAFNFIPDESLIYGDVQGFNGLHYVMPRSYDGVTDVELFGLWYSKLLSGKVTMEISVYKGTNVTRLSSYESGMLIQIDDFIYKETFDLQIAHTIQHGTHGEYIGRINHNPETGKVRFIPNYTDYVYPTLPNEISNFWKIQYDELQTTHIRIIESTDNELVFANIEPTLDGTYNMKVTQRLNPNVTYEFILTDLIKASDFGIFIPDVIEGWRVGSYNAIQNFGDYLNILKDERGSGTQIPLKDVSSIKIKHLSNYSFKITCGEYSEIFHLRSTGYTPFKLNIRFVVNDSPNPIKKLKIIQHLE